MNDREKTQAEPEEPSNDEDLASLLKAVARVPSVPLGVASTVSVISPHVGAFASGPLPLLPAPGSVLGGHYELLSMLGAGGMGAVYAAKNLRTGKEVAVKVLLPESSSRSERVERFVREARAAGRIRHPNVVDVYDVEGEGDVPFLVMERLYGESLRGRMQGAPLAPEEAVTLVLGAMRGVSAAHQQGVIHRDLKPENIFLARTPTSAQPVPKVLDFGVSRMLAHEEIGPAPTTLTRTGHVVGTPSYMSLEQLRGSADVDKLVDVYALGVILYEALSGRRPYDAQNTHELVIRMATEQPTPLRTRAAAVDPTLAAIVMKALARLPGERHATVDAFADALEAWLAGDRTPLAPETVPSPAVPRARRLRWAVPLVLLVGALVAWLTLRSDPPQVPAQASPPKVAQEPEKQASPAPAQPASSTLPPAPTPVSTESERAPPAPGEPGAAPGRKPHRPAKPPDRATHLRVEDF